MNVFDLSITLFAVTYFYRQQYIKYRSLHLLTFLNTFLFKETLLNMLTNLWPISSLQTKWNWTLDLSMLPIGSNTRAHANKRSATALSHMSKEALNAYILPRKMRYFICEHSKTKTVKEQSMCQYQKIYLMEKHLNQIK